MVLIQPGDYLKQWYRISLGDNDASLVFYYPRVAFTNVAYLSNFINNSCARINLNLTPVLGNGDYITGSHLYLLRSGTIVDDLDSGDIPLSVTGSASPLPANAAALSSFRPDPGSPRRVARKYWPFIRADFLATGTTINLGGMIALNSLATLFLSTIDFGGTGFAVRCRVGFTGIWPSPGQLWVSQMTSSLWATQRRRLRGSQKASWS